MSNLEDPTFSAQTGGEAVEGAAQPEAPQSQPEVIPQTYEEMNARITQQIREAAGNELSNEEAEMATGVYDDTLADNLTGGVDSYYGEAFRHVGRVLPRVVEEFRKNRSRDELFSDTAEAASIPNADMTLDPALDFGTDLAYAVIDSSEVLKSNSDEKRGTDIRGQREEPENPGDARNRQVLEKVFARGRKKRENNPNAHEEEERLAAVRDFIGGIGDIDKSPPDSTKN